MPRYRGLVLALERMGVKRPATYASAIRHAAKLGPIEGRRGFIAQAQLQGALALVARMRAVGTLDAAAAERMVERIVASPFTDDTRYAGALAHWFQTDLRPLLPAARDAEGAVLAGLSGPSEDSTPLPRVTWEGQQYRLDFAGAERRRLQRVREKQGAIPLDLALQLADAGRMLGMEAVQPDDLRDLATQMTAIAADIPQRSKEEETDNVPIGVTVPASAHETLRKAAEELTRASRGKDAKRNPKLAEPLVELGDDLFARSLLSLAYAMDVGDPDGTVLLADDVSQRHDFGFSIKDNDARARVVWSVPRQDISPNSPWHVTGSLLGLDMALSSLALRRVSSDHVLEAPRLTSNARDTFAASVSLLNPLELRDGDRDAIVDAVERGRRRLLGGVDPRALDAMADELMMDGARRRALGWTRAHEPERLPLMLSLTELLTLGGGRTADLHAWGMAVTATSGCLCSRLLPPGHWATLSGRPQLGLSAAILPDLGFRVAAMLKELGLPSPLAKVILSGAMQDFIDEVKPTDDNDWLTLSRAARVITRERIEDYIAAATATGPLMPESLRAPER
jgi:hypothetical protein